MTEIKNRFNGKVMFRSKIKTVKQLLEFKVKRGADLSGADLSGADLRDAYLRDAYLSCAYLRGADLRDADLSVKSPPVDSHQFISEVLYRKAKTESQLDFSARIQRQSTCRNNWKFFVNLARKKKVLKWACKILFQWDEFKERFHSEERGIK